MKKIMAIILLFTLSICLTSCTTHKKAKTNTLNIKGVDYRLAFVDELYPDSEEGLSVNSIMSSGKNCYKYIKPDFDCYIAYDKNAAPNIYFKVDEFDKAKAYYSNAENFNFFFLRGNIFDEENQIIYQISDVDSAKFDELTAFASNNSYNPLGANSYEGTIAFPVNQKTKVMNELHFYKESKDGAFSTSRGYDFIVKNGRLYLVYYYDYADENSPVMLVKALPDELSDYFCNLIKELEKDEF